MGFKLGGFSAEKIVLGLVNDMTEEFAAPLVERTLKEHTTADRRVELGEAAIEFGSALKEGRIRDASKVLAHQLGKLRFDIPGL
jgi:hypothetical protein